jgi:hypothetical protein
MRTQPIFNWGKKKTADAYIASNPQHRQVELKHVNEVLQSSHFSAHKALTITGPESGFDGSSDMRLGHAEAVHLVNPAKCI